MDDKQRKFLEQNTINIDGDINVDMARYVDNAIKHFMLNGNPDIDVLITSNGGDVDMGLFIFDLIDTYKGKTRGRVISFARSMGAVILQACTTREATRHSKILIHHVSKRQVGLDTLTDTKKRQDLVDGMWKSQEKLYRILEGRSGKTRQEIVDACLPDTDMTADEALCFGLISSITPSSKKDDGEGNSTKEK